MAALWNYFTFNAADVTPQKSRGALVVLCMAARSKPQILSSQLKSMICICLSRRAGEDSLIARYACIALQRLSDADRVGLGPNHKIFSVLASLIIGPGGFSQTFCVASRYIRQTIKLCLRCLLRELLDFNLQRECIHVHILPLIGFYTDISGEFRVLTLRSLF